MGSAAASNYRAELKPLPPLEQLETLWRGLEDQSDTYFFLTWNWIGTWLEVMKPDCSLLSVYASDQLVALGCITDAYWRKRLRVPISRQLALNETGDAIRDQQWIEYNGLLAARGHKEAATSQAMSFLLGQRGWDELVIGVATAGELALFDHSEIRSRHVRWESTSHAVHLQPLAQEGAFLKTLSRNARHQIKRAARLYESRGELTLDRAASSKEALSMLEEAAPLHIARWGEGVLGSGFSNPRFVSFHCSLVRRCFELGLVDVVRIQFGDTVLGYFYNLLFRGRVYFYLSALASVSDNRLKPGLLGHALLIEHYALRGFQYYDFMGGGEAYKDRLAVRGEPVYRVALQRDRIALRLEALVREVKTSAQGIGSRLKRADTA